ncbi:hypothetical protein D1BOALGB6SA_1022 [Olavius sp. associated proteobacterium Delta 1]|nr:hypothetical protein D1BOALGB6SA_1022 [Olavius sp. associated proteobacterium Delta 1]
MVKISSMPKICDMSDIPVGILCDISQSFFFEDCILGMHNNKIFLILSSSYQYRFSII